MCVYLKWTTMNEATPEAQALYAFLGMQAKAKKKGGGEKKSNFARCANGPFFFLKRQVEAQQVPLVLTVV